MKSWLDRVLSIALTIAILGMTATLFHREFIRESPERRSLKDFPAPELVNEWRSLLGSSVLFGDSGAPVIIVEFADLQCPYCREYHKDLKRLRQQFGSKVALAFVHFPLPYHPSAKLAARAFECSRPFAVSERFLDTVYEKQDSLGAKSWKSFAEEAGVPDTRQFEQCVSDTASVRNVEAGIEAGRKIQVDGTPTVLINGWRFKNAPRLPLLIEVVKALLEGKDPSALTPEKAKASERGR